jgi:replicative DNA helicase
MNVQPIVSLTEIDIELALVGSFIMYPDAARILAEQVDPQWFSEPVLRDLFERIGRFGSDGYRLSAKIAISMLPVNAVEVLGITNAQFVARMCAEAAPATSINGHIEILKERWARRRIKATSDHITRSIGQQFEDPYTLANWTVEQMGEVSAVRRAVDAGSVSEGIASVIEGLDRVHADKLVTTGLTSLDRLLGGYVPGKMYVVAGRPGMGKSAFACSSLRRTAAAGHGVAFFSLEMGQEEVAARCLSDAMGTVMAPGFGDILKNNMTENQRRDLLEMQASFEGLPLHVDASAHLTFNEIAARARKVQGHFDAAGTPLAVICIDHMGIVDPSERYAGNKVAEAGEISRQCKALAKEMDVCVLVLCQLSRNVESRDDKRPLMSDLRWSGEIEQDADIVAFLYREA